MGERLILDINIDEKVVVNVYFHWGAYTRYAVPFLKKFEQEYLEIIQKETFPADKKSQVKFIVELLLKVGASGLLDKSHAYFKQKFPNESYPVATNRNEGLIAIVKEDLKSNRSWYENEASINIDSENGELRFGIGMIFQVENIEEHLLEYQKYKINSADIRVVEKPFSSDFFDMDSDDLTILETTLENNKHSYFKVNDEYYHFF